MPTDAVVRFPSVCAWPKVATLAMIHALGRVLHWKLTIRNMRLDCGGARFHCKRLPSRNSAVEETFSRTLS